MEGKAMKTVSLTRSSFNQINAQAEHEFPYECCGFIVADALIEEVRPIRNIQNQQHAAEPSSFTRDARTAFLMDPKEHLRVLKEIDERKLQLKFVYHSHPDHDAYFSATDRAQACSFDPSEPDYPDTAHIVISVQSGKFACAAAFAWDSERREFVEAELKVC
jgi:proteasome lid subunit RPN8/RPN11